VTLATDELRRKRVCLRASGSESRFLQRQGEADVHLGANALLAFYAQQSVQTLDDQVHPVKTKASVFFFGRKQ
jgi:hypothetical protein